MKIILGSQSKHRRKLMEEMGLEFEVMAAGIDEKAIRHTDPQELVLALAKAKAEALIPRIDEPAILITSDQVIVYEGEIREKPEDAEEARRFLDSYAKHPAETVVAVVVTNLANGKSASAVDIAKVFFSPFSEEEIGKIIEDGEVFHIAGGFDIDGDGWKSHILELEGTRDSVIGLPKEVTKRLISEVTE